MYYSVNQVTTIPLIYGTQPNLGQYFQPDGAFSNPSELLPAGKISEARETQEAAAELLKTHEPKPLPEELIKELKRIVKSAE